MELELRAGLLMRQKKISEARATFDQAAAQEKSLGYREPPIYIRPVHEAQGAALLAAEKWADAQKAYALALMERPRSGFALFGLARSAEGSGDTAEAVRQYRAFLDAWTSADRDLAMVVHAREFVSAHAK